MPNLSKLPRKTVVLGNSCAGKTTFSARLAKLLGCKHIELDALFWEPNWQQARTDIFRSRVTESLAVETWVVDGNYSSKIKDVVWPQADTFIWLDPSLATVLCRFFTRTLRRSLKQEVLWGGCRETLRNSIFQRNSLLIWILKTHHKKSADYLNLVSNPPPKTVVHRLQSHQDIEAFFEELHSA